MTSDSPVQDTIIQLERLARLVRSGEHSSDLNPAQWEALRYLSRCNRFSNSPAALTRYLAATKGTISQTLIALERKGLISKAPRPGEARSVVLSLTPQGTEKLEQDPWADLASLLEGMKPKLRQRFSLATEKLVNKMLKPKALPTFGACASCRYFREGGAPADVKGKHWCLLFEQPITKPEAQKICASHEPV